MEQKTFDDFVMDNTQLMQRLEKPKAKVDVVIDTDTYNEIDDQYALSYLIRSDDKLHLKAIYAAPFFNHKVDSPADGMEKSYQEIHTILELIGGEDLKACVYRGASQYLSNETEPVISEAVINLVELALTYSEANPLYVIAIGAITNIASALLWRPEIKNKIVVIWLGGNALEWPDNHEFNLVQDIFAARVVFNCGVPLIQLPCMGVVSSFVTSGPELEYHLRGKNKLCDYLLDITQREAKETSNLSTWSRAIWDVTAVAWLLGEDFMLDRLEHAPIPEFDARYAFDRTRHFYKYVYQINRDKLFFDLFEKLSK